MIGPERGDGRGHEVPEGRAAGGDAEHPDAGVGQLVHRPPAAGQGAEGLGGGQRVPLAGGCEDAAALAPDEERAAQVSLQPPDVLAHRALGTAQGAGGRAEIELVGDNDQDAEIFEGHPTRVRISMVWEQNPRID